MRICKTLELFLPLGPLEEVRMLHLVYEPRESRFSVEDVAAHSIPSEESLHKLFLRHKCCIFYLENSSSYYKLPKTSLLQHGETSGDSPRGAFW